MVILILFRYYDNQIFIHSTVLEPGSSNFEKEIKGSPISDIECIS